MVALLFSALIVASVTIYVVLSASSAQETAVSTNRSVGSSANDFWHTYPSTRADHGSTVSHPAWVQSALDKGPVMVFVHLEDCMACAVQAPICLAVNGSQ